MACEFTRASRDARLARGEVGALACIAVCSSSLATRPVQPVWWLAPTPRPLSPWKYSWNGHVVAPVRVVLEQLDVAEDRPSTVSVAQEDALQAARDVGRDLPQRQLLARARRRFDQKIVAVVVVELLERLDNAGN